VKNPFYISYADIISQLSYDQFGQPKINKTDGTQNGSDRWQEVDYRYNIRGWLTRINDVGLVLYGKDAEPPTMGDDLFAFRIQYNELANGGNNYTEPLYNGNIAQTFWKTADDNIMRGYHYTYDQMNRLRRADFYKSGNAGITAYGEFISYDLNGNIKNLYRSTGDANDNEIDMDNLTYDYHSSSSNILRNVTDAVSSQNTGGFKDGNTGPWLDDYAYDENGNMTLDRNKGITEITYNHLNLPVEITWSSTKKIEYIYNAAGQKVQKKVTDGNTIKEVDYLDGFQYAGGILQFFPHPEGYVRATPVGSMTPGAPPASYAYNYVYNYTDHLGNVRLSYSLDPQTQQLKILDESHYYPFGLKHSVYTPNTLKDFTMDDTPGGPGTPVLINVLTTEYMYKYNGKEFQDELGLGVYDYGARMYMPDLGRWNGIDNKAEKFSPVSPYVYAANNPIIFIDIDGNDLILRFQCDSAKEAYTTVVNSAMGGKYEVEYIPMKGGYYQVKLNTIKSDVKLSKEQKAFYKEYNKVVKAKEEVFQSVFQEESDIKVDSFVTGNIDIADVEAFDAAGEGGSSSAGALIHSHSEQLEKAKMGLKKGEGGKVEKDANGKILTPDYDKAHAEGIKSENKVNGNTRGFDGNEKHFKEPNGNITKQTLDDSDGFKVTKENISAK